MVSAEAKLVAEEIVKDHMKNNYNYGRFDKNMFIFPKADKKPAPKPKTAKKPATKAKSDAKSIKRKDTKK